MLKLARHSDIPLPQVVFGDVPFGPLATALRPFDLTIRQYLVLLSCGTDRITHSADHRTLDWLASRSLIVQPYQVGGRRSWRLTMAGAAILEYATAAVRNIQGVPRTTATILPFPHVTDEHDKVDNLPLDRVVNINNDISH